LCKLKEEEKEREKERKRHKKVIEIGGFNSNQKAYIHTL
jgi:hypothetical protein